MFHTAVYFSFIISIFSIQSQHACEVTDQTHSFKNGQGEATITLDCDYECNNINTYLELFNFRLRENQIENFEETIRKAKQTKSDFVISENFKAITFFNTTWKECYQRHSHLKTFLTSIYLQNLTDFTGYFIKKPKIDSKPTLGGYFLEPTVFGEEGSPLLISNRGIIIVFTRHYYLESKIHYYMKEAFEIRLKRPQITNYKLHTIQTSLKGTIKQFTTNTHMQSSKHKGYTKNNDEPAYENQSDSGMTRLIILVIFVFLAIISLKICCNFRTEPTWQYPETENTETFTFESNRSVEQSENQYEEREETTL